jgi:RNA polymerase sigma factor (sigma-70 family)
MPRIDETSVERLYRRGGGDRWGACRPTFGAAIERAAAILFPSTAPSARELERRLDALHLDDLVLASACADGHDAAWEHFVREFRPALYRAAAAIAPGGNSRELADSLYGDLFGLKEQAGERRSLFRYFHGRSSLATWLRAVLAQRHVDGLRANRRLDPLPDENSQEAPAVPHADPPSPSSHCAEVIQQALTAAITRLASRDRLRLAWYYGQNMTLAQIGRALGEHEATVSRHLSRARKTVRVDVERHLSVERGMSERDIEECFASLTEDAGTLDLREVLETVERKGSPVDRSTSEGMP